MVENRVGDPIFHPILDPILAPQKPRIHGKYSSETIDIVQVVKYARSKTSLRSTTSGCAVATHVDCVYELSVSVRTLW